ncbi:transmembrane amino acid transporter protein-domain-containing protein [Lipomyces oligophaga]|uniref:transmembrane amino acid transporter protein-domain-containing protein n=1 Tax=Lipomyces oligophaga TaxID=45792 RepID=UPI0034CD6028
MSTNHSATGYSPPTVEYIEDDEEEEYFPSLLQTATGHGDLHEDDSHGKQHGQASLGSSISNLSNTILGAGILAMPHAIRNDGVVLGFFVIVFSGFTSGFGLFLQYRCSRYVERGSASFFAVAQRTYPQLAGLFDAAIAIKCYGVGVSYMIIIGDLMPQVIVDFFYSTTDELPESILFSRHFWISVFMVALIPLCFMRKLDSLRYTSIVALFAIGYLTCLVISHWFVGDTIEYRGEISLGPKSLISVLTSLPIIVFGFTCHQNMFSVVNELRDNRPASVLTVIMSSIGLAVVLYSVVGLTGYLSFGDNVGGNISSMYSTSVWSAIGRAAIVILVLFSFPLQAHPCRASVDHIFAHILKPWATRTPAPSPTSSRPGHAVIPTRRFYTITALIMGLTYLVAMTVSSLEAVLAFVGATGSTSISFILPGLFGYKLLGSPYYLPVYSPAVDDETNIDSTSTFDSAVHLPDSPDEARTKLRGEYGEGYYIKYGSLALACWGILVMVLCLSSNFYTLYVLEEERK